MDAEQIYRKIEPNLRAQKGKIVAIHVESGDYFVGDTAIEAYHKGVQKYPHQQFVFKRIGFKHTYFVGRALQ